MGAPVVHFEIYGKDASKLQSFYADLFGWEIHADNPMNYGIVHTNSGDKGIGGGITEGDARVNVVVDVARRLLIGGRLSSSRSTR